MRSRYGIAGLVALAILCDVPKIHGQLLTPAPEGTPGWIFTPSMSFGGFWDDNVLLMHPDAETPGDYTSPVNPSLKVDFLGRQTSVSVGYDGSIVLHRTLDELNSFNQTAQGRLQHRASRRIVLSIDDSFSAAPTTDALELAGVPFYRVGSRSNALTGAVEVLARPHTVLRGGYSLRTVSFDTNDEQQQLGLRGGHSHEFSVTLEHALSQLLTIGAEYGFVHAIIGPGTTDPADPLVTDTADDRFNIHGASFTAKYQVTPIWTFHGGVGLSRLGASLSHEARTGPTLQAGVIREGRRMIVTGQYGRSFVPSFGFGGTSQTQHLSGSVRVPFGRNRLYAEASASMFDNDAFETGQQSLRSTWLSGKVGYSATRWLRIEGLYGRSYQDSHLAGGKRNRNTIGFQIVTSKPFKVQ